MEAMMALTIPMVFVVSVALIMRWLSDNRVRRELIAAGASPDLVEKLFARPPENLESSLKWGMVFVAIGVALVAIHFLNLDAEEPLSFALMFIGGGAGLLGYYTIKSKTA